MSIKRTTRFTRRKPLYRKKPLAKYSKKPHRMAKRFVPKWSIKVVKERSGNQCERYFMATLANNDLRMWRCRHVAAPIPHHVHPRARGGNHQPENLKDLCIRCHTWVHANPKAATMEGLLK